MSLLFKYKVNCEYKKEESNQVVNPEVLGTEYNQCEDCKNQNGDNFLNNFKFDK